MRKQATFGDTTNGFPVKWRLRNEHRNSLLITLHYPDLGSASDWSCRMGKLIHPIRNTTQIWIVTRHQYAISVLVSQMSSCRETVGGIAKCHLFSQARVFMDSHLKIKWNCHVKCKCYSFFINYYLLFLLNYWGWWWWQGWKCWWWCW